MSRSEEIREDRKIRETEKVLQLASEGSVAHTIKLTHSAGKVPKTLRPRVFAHFLDTLRHLDSLYDDDDTEPFLKEDAELAMKILNGIGRCLDYVDKDQNNVDALLDDWFIVASCARRFTDNFKSVEEPSPGASITYEDWYGGLMLTLLITTVGEEVAHEMWTVPDARCAMCRLWLLNPPPLMLHFVTVCSSILKIFVLFQDQYDSDFAVELVDHPGVNDESVAHLVMARYIDATKNGNVTETLDHAYIVHALISSPNDTIRSILLKKKAMSFLTKNFVACTRDDPEWNLRNRDFIEHYLFSFEIVAEKDCAFPYIIQALRHGFLQGVVACSPALNKMHERTVGAVKNIIGNVLIMYLVYYPFVVAALVAIKEIKHKDVERFIDPTVLKSEWARLEEHLLTYSVIKSYFDQSINSDMSIIICAQCAKKEDKNNFQKCGGCQNVHYCSKDCQTKHWKLGGHREACKNLLDEMRGWGRQDQKYREFLSVLDVHRHWKAFHELAVEKYGHDQIPPVGAKSVPYGYSVDYTTAPPTLSVFWLDEEAQAQEPHNEVESEMAKLAIGERRSQMCVMKVLIPEGRLAKTHVIHGTLDIKDDEIWEDDFDAWLMAQGLRLRAPGVDEDGEPLHAIPDQVDRIISDLPPKIRIGTHPRWSRCTSGCCGGGQVVLSDEIDRLAKSLLSASGDLLPENPNASRKTKESKCK